MGIFNRYVSHYQRIGGIFGSRVFLAEAPQNSAEAFRRQEVQGGYEVICRPLAPQIARKLQKSFNITSNSPLEGAGKGLGKGVVKDAKETGGV